MRGSTDAEPTARCSRPVSGTPLEFRVVPFRVLDVDSHTVKWWAMMMSYASE